ncbi:MAG: protein translocase subunit SecD [Acidobacteria bacterium]|nr:protein translocase subunit SecD [Acidobacteriota bacterium]
MFKSLKVRYIIILIICAGSAYLFYPPKEKINFGLDLKGGMHLVLEVKTDKVIRAEVQQYGERIKRLMEENKTAYTQVLAEDTKITLSGVPEGQSEATRKNLKDYFGHYFDVSSKFEGGAVSFTLNLTAAAVRDLEQTTVQSSRDTLERRIDAYGVAEPTLQLFGSTAAGTSNQIIVELPGVENPEEVKTLLKETASLSLNMVHPTAPYAASLDAINQFFGGQIPGDHTAVLYTGDYSGENRGEQEKRYIVVQKAPVITGKHLTNARASQDSSLGLSRPAVSFTLNSEGARLFGDATEANQGRQLAIILDDKAISAPRIEAKITDSGIITGIDSERESQLLALSLPSGALPADIVILEERTVGPSLGLESIRQGVNAGLLGLALIVLFMVFYYRLSGFNAVLCLIVNVLILFGVMGYFRATLTLPGIAGIILTIGMAVDSNVLIFERIREELRWGKTVAAAVDAGFARASWTIFDANVTTLISAAFLYQFGTGPIRGFAVTLTFGLLANLFAAIFVSRTIFNTLLQQVQIKKLSI